MNNVLEGIIYDDNVTIKMPSEYCEKKFPKFFGT